MFEPSVKETGPISCIIIILSIEIFKIYIDITEFTGEKYFCIINFFFNILILIMICIFRFKEIDELSNTFWFFVFSIYGLFLPILGLAIYFRLLLPENIKNKYLVITLIQLFMAHGVNYTKLGIDDD